MAPLLEIADNRRYVIFTARTSDCDHHRPIHEPLRTTKLAMAATAMIVDSTDIAVNWRRDQAILTAFSGRRRRDTLR